MQLPNQLSYKRSINPSKAIFYYRRDEDLYPLPVERIKIRGSKSGFSEAYTAKGIKESATIHSLATGNPHTIDTCYLPPTADSLVCRFSLRVSANSLFPDRCSEIAFKDTVSQFLNSYIAKDGFKELAIRYSKNIAMGTWLWRNKEGNTFDVLVRTSQGNEYKFKNAHMLFWDSVWPDESSELLALLSEELAVALTKPRYVWHCDVWAEVKMPFCSEVFPSQCFVDHDDKQSASKVLLTTDIDGVMAACYNADKVGAAIQMIDDWWDESCDFPLRVNEYAADHENLIARRHPSTERDFYQCLQNLRGYTDKLNKVKSVDDIEPDAHFVASVLVKGGMFQGGKS
ncbi:type I-F CRISPR-associated protein Csy3 [Maribrevibacterium harenarium]|uniref:Type I-F CRISPR-associated protein Csy3 n=1 Tax=Maribrevibacterium harenarium TaxID=2589817 RepID=A0A501WAK8_9GAMM|nr:type I-F CRISPR-associated protein Csy3 [Maribrevibacterium harenarium]TPE46669.1 type I-F CRISPR-associated protein Csy3 [Maribrevibacterium harenarium]